MKMPIVERYRSVRFMSRLSLLAGCMLPVMAGCGGGGMTIIGITPTTAQTLDAGQTLQIQAALVNDIGHKGATFALTGPGTLGTPVLTQLSASSDDTVLYTAPSSSSANATATVTATSVNTPSQTATVTIIINPALTIATTSLPAGTVGTAYSTTLASTGGSGTLKWSLTSGALPGGVFLNSSTGAISGTPTTFGTFSVGLSLTDSATTPVTVSTTFTLTIAPMAPTITTNSLPNAVAGIAYSQQLTYSGGGLATPVFAIVSGALPAGLTLSAGGLIAGTPTNAAAGATYTFAITVAVGTQTSVSKTFTLTIPALPAVSTASLPSGNIGVAYSQQLSYTGGAGGTVSWAITAGSLAGSGLTLSPGGLISGTPTTATTYSFSVAVTVGTQTSAAKAFTLTVNSLIITSGATASGEVGLPFSFQLAVRGGTGPYTWALAAGSSPLPVGVTSLNAATGLITGSPTTTTGSPFGNIVVQATDSLGATATQAMTFTINPARGTSNNAELGGQYAFLLSGFDANGNPLVTTGEFTANGSGTISGGVKDVNGTGAGTQVTATPVTGGSYSVGADNRGDLVLTTASGTNTYAIALNSVVSGVATGGYITEFDSTGQSMTGVLALQTPAAFATAKIVNGFAFGVDGFAAGSTASSLQHRATIGEIQFGSAGGFGSGELLSSGSGNPTPVVPASGSISIGANGRGTMSLVLPSGTGFNTVDLVVYVVSATKLFIISSDPASSAGGNDLISGQALQQSVSSFSVTSLNNVSVVRTDRLGVTTSGAVYPDMQVGLYTFNGAGHIGLTSDENAGGVVTSNSLNGNYVVASNGRVTLNLSSGFGGCADCVSVQTFFYLVGNNQGFAMDFTGPVTSGYFEPQTATTFSAATFSGNYSAGSIEPLTQASTYDAEAVSASGTGTLTGTADTAAAGTLTPDNLLTGSYTVGTNGRATLTLGSGASPVMYIISPTKALLLDLTSATPVVQEVLHQ